MDSFDKLRGNIKLGRARVLATISEKLPDMMSKTKTRIGDRAGMMRDRAADLGVTESEDTSQTTGRNTSGIMAEVLSKRSTITQRLTRPPAGVWSPDMTVTSDAGKGKRTYNIEFRGGTQKK